MLGDDLKGRAIAQYFWDEIEKIAKSEDPSQAAMVKEEEVDQVTEVKRINDPKVTSPGQMFGVQFSKLRDGSARMSPMYMPVPGYTFKPELQRFVPDLNQPGWITSGEEMMARSKREGYIQAKKEEAMARFQQEASNFMKNPTPESENQGQPAENEVKEQKAESAPEAQPAPEKEAPQQTSPPTK